MKALLVVAGYGTRLYNGALEYEKSKGYSPANQGYVDITKNTAKALLDIGGRKIIDYMMEQIENIPRIDGTIIVSNHTYLSDFERWKQESDYKKPIHIIDNGVDFDVADHSKKDTRKGFFGDTVIGLPDEDTLVLAGDNFIEFKLSDILDAYRGEMLITYERMSNTELITKKSILKIDQSGRVIDYIEKPTNQQISEIGSNFTSPPFYVLPAKHVPKLREIYKNEEKEGRNTDGNLVQRLFGNEVIYAVRLPGSRKDVGDFKEYLKLVESNLPVACLPVAHVTDLMH